MAPPAVVADACFDAPRASSAIDAPASRVALGPNRLGGTRYLGGDWVRGTPAATWATGKLPVSFTLAVGPSGTASRDLGAEALAELDVALRAWPRVACTAYRTALGGSSATLTPGADGVNGVFFHDDAWPGVLTPGVLAQTVLSTDANGDLADADIHVNGADYTWSLDGHGTTIDLRSILTHELGHALGLGHSPVIGATMTATNPPGIAWRSLEQDDRDGVCALYPGAGAAGCESGPACPTGFVCVAQVCERAGARGEVCAPCTRVVGACAGAGDDARCVDIGAGATAGLVCGRACTGDADCGPRFRCAPTTTSGDVQCVPTDGCASGPDACATDADCAGALCRGGACVGAPDVVGALDAGAEAGVDAGVPAARVVGGGGCATAEGAPTSCAHAGVAVIVALLWVARRAWSVRAARTRR